MFKKNYFAALVVLISWGVIFKVQAESMDPVDSFRTKSAAHQLRVSKTVVELLKDEKFLRSNPEFRPLAVNLESSLKAALNHDYNKTHLPRTDPIIQGLSSDYGTDYRSLPKNSLLRKNLENNIDRLNQADQLRWEHATQKYLKDKKNQGLLTDLVSSIDYHDVAMARKAEFGNGPDGNIQRPFLSASEWIQEKNHELGLDSRQKKRMLHIANYLEKDFDYNKVIATYDPKIVEKEGVGNLIKQLKTETHQAQNSRIKPPLAKKEIFYKTAGATKSLAKNLGRAPVFAAGFIGYEYFAHPETFGGDSLMHGLPIPIESTSACQMPQCASFLESCRQLKKDEATCVRDEFFTKLPLHEQTRRRQELDLNRILSRYSPMVTDLRCEMTGPAKNYLVSMVTTKGEIQTQKIKLSPQDQVTRVQINNSTSILFSKGRPGLLQYPENQVYRNLSPEDWTHKHIYPHSSLAGHSAKISAIQQGQETLKLLNSQMENIGKCCKDIKCTDYFAKTPSKRIPSAPAPWFNGPPTKLGKR